MITALALDQSPRHTGWAIGSPNDPRPKWGALKLKPWGDDEGERLLEFYNWLTATILDNHISHVFYESPFIPGHGNFHSIEPQFFLIGTINLVAAQFETPVAQVPMQSWRSRFLGTSKAPPGLKGDAGRKALKEMALKACAIRGWLVEDDNIAEALGILDYGLSTLDRKHAGKADILFRRQELKLWNGER
jgi:hypothetical protein